MAYFNTVTLTANYQPLSAAYKPVSNCVISFSPDNTGTAYILGVADADVPMAPGEWHRLELGELSSIQVKGTAGDVVTIVGE